MATTSATASPLPSSLLRRPSPLQFPRPLPLPLPHRPSPSTRLVVACSVAIDTDVSSSETDEDLQALAKVGKRVRVKVPLKVYHVMKAPELELLGMEGVIKQYVGVWKGKKISANLPFKVEFIIPGDSPGGKPIKFSAHLREDELEFLPDD